VARFYQGSRRTWERPRRRGPIPAVAVLLALALGLVHPAAAATSTWSISLEGTLDGAPFQVGFQVTLPEPDGATIVTVGGLPVQVARSVTEFSFLVNTTFVAQGCTVSVFASGVASIGGASAPGAVSGVRRKVCPVAQPQAFCGTSFCSPPPAPVPPPGSFLTEAAVGGSFVATQIDGTGAGFLDGLVGTVQIKTPRTAQPAKPGAVVTPGSLIETGGDGSAVVGFLDGSRVTVGPNTLVTVVPPANPASPEVILSQIKGTLGHSVVNTAGGPDQYRVRTAVWTIQPTGTDFTTSYGESGLRADLTVAVQQGIVEVLGRRAELFALAAGTQQSFTDSIPRSTPILPVNGGSVLAGKTNSFTWTALPGAIGYIFEFTFNAAGFSQANPPAPESVLKLTLAAGSIIQTSGVVEFPALIPDGAVPHGTVARWRVFPTDAAGVPLPGSTGSDAYVVKIE
jgi:hypothetical protein